MIAPPAIFAALAAMFYLGVANSSGRDLPSTFIGKPTPPVTEALLGDYPGVTAASLTGEVTLVNFWASWCPPCRAEHPVLLELAGQGIRIVGINFNDREADALKYLSDDGNPFVAIAFDPNGRTSFDWGVSAPPETFIVDESGIIVFKFTGPLVGDDYDQRFAPELAKALGG
jgi:cytochrome c biogenesis protein CcmG, thiol:disulfide interchange protein DsbE